MESANGAGTAWDANAAEAGRAESDGAGRDQAGRASCRSAADALTGDEIAALPAIISKHEVARICRVSTRTIVREAGKGNIDGAFRVANVWRFNTRRVCEQFGLVR